MLRVDDGSRFHRVGTAVENEFLQKFEGAYGWCRRGTVLCLNAATVMAVDDWWRWQGSPGLYEQWDRAWTPQVDELVASGVLDEARSVAPLHYDAWVTARTRAFWTSCRRSKLLFFVPFQSLLCLSCDKCMGELKGRKKRLYARYTLTSTSTSNITRFIGY